MHYNDDEKHHLPHLHAEYAEFDGVFDFQGNMIQGKIPAKQRKMIEVWINIHKEELQSLWNVIKQYKQFFKIDPLK